MEFIETTKITRLNTNQPRGTGSNTDNSTLERFCFDSDAAESDRHLAWVNSICAAFLMIGLIGIQPHTPTIAKRTLPVEEIVATTVEPVTISTGGGNTDLTPEPITHNGAAAIAVTLDSPAVVFSVPTAGNVLVPVGLAQAPPANPLIAIAPLGNSPIGIAVSTGTSGSRPAPAYPAESLRAHEQGTVVLLIEVTENGQANSVMVKESSGYRRLDQAAVEVVHRFWYFGHATGKRLYESPIVFRLQ